MLLHMKTGGAWYNLANHASDIESGTNLAMNSGEPSQVSFTYCVLCFLQGSLFFKCKVEKLGGAGVQGYRKRTVDYVIG